MSDHRLKLVRAYHGIEKLDDWERLTPADVIRVPGAGPATLDLVRMFLAFRNKTLLGDQTPDFWREFYSEARVCGQLTEEDRSLVAPFRIVVDSREQAPYTFEGYRSADGQPLIIPTAEGGLPTGDYSIAGYEDEVCVERKSIGDLFATLGQRREQFEAEHDRMAGMASACVVIEATWDDIILRPPKQSLLNPKSVFGTAASWLHKYGVPWFTLGHRKAAELWTYTFLKAFHKQKEKCQW